VRRFAVSLLELVIAVVILGVLAAVTLPRLSRASPPPDQSNVLKTQLKVLRCAVERYTRDHGVFPGQRGDGSEAAGSEAALVNQLTSYTDAQGRVLENPSDSFHFGPYLREGVPGCAVRSDLAQRVHVVNGAGNELGGVEPGEVGWVYDCQTGRIRANAPGDDRTGQAYVTY
jgi:general secretion pathway protein G